MSKPPSQRASSLKPQEFKKYLNVPVFLSLYKDVNKDGSLQDINNFYLNFLRTVFKPDDGFTIWFGHRASDVGSYLDIKNLSDKRREKRKKTVIIASGRQRAGGPHAPEWDAVVGHAAEYAREVRAEEDGAEHLYVAVNVGNYVSFHELPAGSADLRHWAPAGATRFELADDEEELWALWLRIRDLVSVQQAQG